MFLMCWKLTGKSYALALPIGPAIASPAPRTPVVAIARATTRASEAIRRALYARLARLSRPALSRRRM
jgi:hypothetical protein